MKILRSIATTIACISCFASALQAQTVNFSTAGKITFATNGVTLFVNTNTTPVVVPPTPDLVAYYFGSTYFGSQADSSGNGFNMGGTGGLSGGTGPTGNGATVGNGTDASWNSSTGSHSEFGTKPFTYACWVKLNLGVYQTILGSVDPSGPEISIASTGEIVFNSQFSAAIGTSSSAIPNNTWCYVAVTYDTSGNWVVYINGVTNAGDSGTNLQSFSTQSQNIGLNGSVGTSHFNGSIADFEGFKHACTQAEITALYTRVSVP